MNFPPVLGELARELFGANCEILNFYFGLVQAVVIPLSLRRHPRVAGLSTTCLNCRRLAQRASNASNPAF